MGFLLQFIVLLQAISKPSQSFPDILGCAPLMERITGSLTNRYYVLVLRHTARWEEALAAEQRARESGSRDPMTDPKVRATYDEFARHFLPIIRATIRKKIPSMIASLPRAKREAIVMEDLVDEASQEFFVALIRGRNTYDPHKPFFGWCDFKARRAIQDVLRRRGREWSLAEGDEGKPYDLVDRRLTRERELEEAYRGFQEFERSLDIVLSPLQSTTLKAYLDWKLDPRGRTKAELVQGLGITEGAFNERIQKAQKRIRGYFANKPAQLEVIFGDNTF